MTELCQACEVGDHANCGRQTWCQCPCDPDDDAELFLEELDLPFLDGDDFDAGFGEFGGLGGLNPATLGRCSVCGCTEESPCPGGCIWANSNATLCSRCARGAD